MIPQTTGRGPATRNCGVVDAGCLNYDAGLKLQARARALVQAGEWDGILVLLEHPPVITMGRRGGAEHLLLEEAQLTAQGIHLAAADRGGDITGHNPGQLVGYPILNLRKWKQDVHWYIRAIETVLIETLACYQLRAGRKPPFTGVWVDDRKIAAIGILISRWVTSHGFALNINNNLDLFELIVPCGIREYGVTSLARSGIGASMEEVKLTFLEQFKDFFDCRFTEIKGVFLEG